MVSVMTVEGLGMIIAVTKLYAVETAQGYYVEARVAELYSSTDILYTLEFVNEAVEVHVCYHPEFCL